MSSNHHPIISTDLAEFLTPGVIVEVDPDEAEDLGAFEETALTDASAWEANSDGEGM
jgi:hypothetical protein